MHVCRRFEMYDASQNENIVTMVTVPFASEQLRLLGFGEPYDAEVLSQPGNDFQSALDYRQMGETTPGGRHESAEITRKWISPP